AERSVSRRRDRTRREQHHLARYGAAQRWCRVGAERPGGHRGLVREPPPAAFGPGRECRVSLTVCLAPANTIGYPQGGGHLWVYLNWALALRAAGCRVIWLEGVDDAAGDSSVARRRRSRGRYVRECVAALKAHLGPYGLADALA